MGSNKKDTIKNINLEFLKKQSTSLLQNKPLIKIIGVILLAANLSTHSSRNFCI